MMFLLSLLASREPLMKKKPSVPHSNAANPPAAPRGPVVSNEAVMTSSQGPLLNYCLDATHSASQLERKGPRKADHCEVVPMGPLQKDLFA